MIAWLNPGAWWAATLVVVPLVIHLLRMHHARRVPFPTLRFVLPSETSAIRVRPPADAVLLLVRMAIVALAALAMAQPLVITSERLESWNARVARVVILDTSQSVRTAGGETAAAQFAAAELSRATYARRIDSPDLDAALRRATAWLDEAPPARREIVVISDFQAGALRDTDLRAVPAAVGVRLLPVGDVADRRTLQGLVALGAGGIGARSQQLVLGPETTALTVVDIGEASLDGLRLGGRSALGNTLDTLLRTVARAGVPAPSVSQRLAVDFVDAASSGRSDVRRIGPGQPPWMLKTVLGARADAALGLAAADSVSVGMPAGDAWSVVADDRNGAPLVRAAALGGELLVEIAAPPDTYFAAVALRALLAARHGSLAYPEQEPAGIGGPVLAGLSRPAGPVDQSAWRRGGSSDARWCWALALLLLAVEQRVRRHGTRDEGSEARRAA